MLTRLEGWAISDGVPTAMKKTLNHPVIFSLTHNVHLPQEAVVAVERTGKAVCAATYSGNILFCVLEAGSIPTISTMYLRSRAMIFRRKARR